MTDVVHEIGRRLVGTRLYGPLKAVQDVLPSRRAARALRAEFYRQFVPEDGLVFDIGANVGNRVEAFLGLGARVVAVEPQPRCVRALKARFGTNSDLTVLPIGLDEEPGEQIIHLATNHVLSSMSLDFIANPPVEGERFEEPLVVRVATLDTLITAFGTPDFCKIDVEGYEPHVLRGLSRPLPALSIEFNPAAAVVVEECVGLLEALGRYEFAYSQGESMRFHETGWTSWDRLSGLLATMPFGDVYARRIP